MSNQITDEDLFMQITINQEKMLDALLSQEAEIKRLKFRLGKLESLRGEP